MLLKSLRSRRERYRILTRKRKWPIDTHSILVMVVSMWHNFIRRNSIFEEPEFYEDLPDRTNVSLQEITIVCRTLGEMILPM
jgi:hypothetical protein